MLNVLNNGLLWKSFLFYYSVGHLVRLHGKGSGTRMMSGNPTDKRIFVMKFLIFHSFSGWLYTHNVRIFNHS